MQLIAGLGNPGAQYGGTPHNLGFEVVEALARRWGVPWRNVSRWRADVARRAAGDWAVNLVKPLTYMNLSGEAVSAVAGFYQIEAAEILVVVDDFNLPLGRLRLREGGTDGGHNGLKSIIRHLGTTGFPRLRIGCAPASGEMGGAIGFVLGKMGLRERRWADEAVDAAADAVEAVLEVGLVKAMTRYNGLEIGPPDSR